VLIGLLFSNLPAAFATNNDGGAVLPAPLSFAAANFDNEPTKNPLGEFVELRNTTGEDLSLNGVTLKYNEGTVLVDFPVNSFVEKDGYLVLKNGEHFSRNLSMTSGTLTLELDGQEIDKIEWDKTMKMDGTNRSATLVVCREADCEAEYLFEKEYVLHEDGYFEVEVSDDMADDESEGDRLYGAEVLECDGLILNEIYAYYENNASEQFIEFHNPTEDLIELKTCQIWVKYGGKYQKFAFQEGAVEPDGYAVFYPSEHAMKLAKSPSGTEVILLLDDDPDYILDASVSLAGQKQAWSFALIDGTWVKTMHRTPASPNVLQVCPAGKITNPSTGKCIGIVEDEPLPDCGAGKFRNPETNRCKSYETLTSVLAPCNEGYYRNELTNRCRKIAVAEELKPCDEGYERNPETNRCRKIRENTGADYATEPISYSDKASFVAWGAASGVTAMGAGYTIFQFRSEIWRFVKKLLRIKK
jgi:hypothetical protein